jgi:UDP-N-acetylmuramoyl-tripeptide--D-alanyl-D-alanine ligase
MEIAHLYQLFLKYPSVQTDTRKLMPGDIFFALSGPNFNGNAFAKDALAKGASYAVIDQPEYTLPEGTILVDDVLLSLQQLACYHRQQTNIPYIAITGSNGKTTTKELIACVLSSRYKTYATEGNLNNHIGVPLTLLKIKQDAEMAIIEMGANHQQEIAAYCQIALPTHGLITNCGKAHIEGFGGAEGVRKGKGELYDFLRATNGTIFRNTDLDYLAQMAQGIDSQVTYGTSNATYTGTGKQDGVFLTVDFNYDGREYTIRTQLVGAYNQPNAMAAVALGLYFGVTPQQIVSAIEQYNPDNSRSQWMQKGTNQIILDAYNANPTSMKAAIENFAASPLANKILWIGGMKEMGAAEATEHTELVDLIGRYSWTDVILVGHEFAGLHGNYTWFRTSAEAAEYVQRHPVSNSSVLIKGSRGSRMELMEKAL